MSWAEQHIASGIAALMVASIPLWMVLLDALRPRGTKPDAKVVVGLLVGFGGIALLVSSGVRHHPRRMAWILVGLGVLLLAALLWSIGSLYGRDADMPQSSLMGTAMEMLAGAAGLLVVGTIARRVAALRLANISLNSGLGLAYLIVFGSLVGFVSYSWLLRNAPISLVSTYAYVNPLVAIFVGAWLASELLTHHHHLLRAHHHRVGGHRESVASEPDPHRRRSQPRAPPTRAVFDTEGTHCEEATLARRQTHRKEEPWMQRT